MGNYYSTNLVIHSVKRLFSNKIRFFITLVGAIVGVILFTFTVLNFDNNFRKVNKKYEDFGSDTIFLNGDIMTSDYQKLSEWDRVKNITYYNSTISAVPYNSEHLFFYINGVGDNFLQMPIPDVKNSLYVAYSELLYGRDFNEIERKGLLNTAIINESTSVLFFGKRNSVGEKITLKIGIGGVAVNFDIIGVIRDSYDSLMEFDTEYDKLESGKMFEKGFDEEFNSVIVPNSLSFNFYVPQSVYDIYKKSTTNINKVVITNSGLSLSEVLAFINKNFENSSLASVQTSAMVAKQLEGEISSFKNIYLVMSILFMLISCLTLVVIMLFSIKERVYEIGIKKALGAKNVDIALQFMTEFCIIGILGSVIGVMLGILAFCVNCFVSCKGVLYFYVFPSAYAIVAPFFIMVAFISVLSIIPAIVAGRVNIIDAIRFE